MHDPDLVRAAHRRLSARRRRDGRLRLRAVLLSLALFGLFWVIVFGQMVSGHDPVLSSKKKTAAGSPASANRRQGGSRRQSRATGQPQLAIDPQTGAIVQVPPAATAPSAPSTAAPTPVTTSQS
jgi:hypothetical protein